MKHDDRIETVRLARASDYPATRLIELPTHVGTSDTFSDSFDIAERVLGEKVSQGALFAYLFRRFGHPNRGSDPDKDLVSYMLTTTRPDMLLRITPYAGGDVSIGFSFQVPFDVHDACSDWISRARDAHETGFLDWIEAEGRVPDWAEETAETMTGAGWPIRTGAEGWRRMMGGIAMIAYSGVKEGDDPDKAEAIRWYQSVRADYEARHPLPPVQWRSDDVASWEDDDPMKPYAEAMADTLRDLLRPVWIRDSAIGIYGPIDEADPEALGNVGADVDSAAAAGYPSGNLGNYDPRKCAELQGAVLRLDPDPVVAMTRALAILADAENAVADRDHTAPEETDGGED